MLMTLSSFKKNLKAGRYANATSAKRALGRAKDMTEDDKAAARRAAERHFGVTPVKKPAKKAAAKGKSAVAKKARAPKAAHAEA